MNVEIQTSTKINRHLNSLIKSRVEKLEMFYNRIIQVDIFFKTKKHGTPEDKVAEIKVMLPGASLFAKSHAENHEKAFVQALEKIKTQLLKRKDRIQHH